MADKQYFINESTLTSLADAVREKTGKSDKLSPAALTEVIRTTVADWYEYASMAHKTGSVEFDAAADKNSAGTIFVKKDLFSPGWQKDRISGTIDLRVLDSKLKAENIKSGIEIFGIAGTCESTSGNTPAVWETYASWAQQLGLDSADLLWTTPGAGKIKVQKDLKTPGWQNDSISGTIDLVKLDSDFKAENIKEGQTIFGVTGTYAATTGNAAVSDLKLINNSYGVTLTDLRMCYTNDTGTYAEYLTADAGTFNGKAIKGSIIFMSATCQTGGIVSIAGTTGLTSLYSTNPSGVNTQIRVFYISGDNPTVTITTGVAPRT